MAAFALCLTHDVDRPYKTYQSLYYALKERDPAHLSALRKNVNPYWQFESLMDIEDELGVRSAFYFLSERSLFEYPPREWLCPQYWLEHFGRYDLEEPRITELIERLDKGGWEVGLHGSYSSYDDPERLGYEKSKIERALGHEVLGGRQHYLNRAPETWNHHQSIGLSYDSSLGSSTEYGFQYGYDLLHPLDDEFAVFPLTVMEVALMNATETLDAAWAECERLLAEADEYDAVMTVLWHPRYISADFPGYRRLYRRLIERALEMGAWVGPPGEYYTRFAEIEDAPERDDEHTAPMGTDTTNNG